VPHGHWKTTTFLAALRVSGLTAPLVADGAINGALFRGWVELQLAPTLRPGDIVVMDNLAAHKVAGVRQAIEAARAEVAYLPPYSPDLNPIETARQIGRATNGGVVVDRLRRHQPPLR
jgi:transposase